MNKLINRIDKLLTDTIAVGDVETNLTQGNVDLVGDECPEGYHWCPDRKKCVPIGSGDREGPRKKRISESAVSGDIVGPGRMKSVDSNDGEIEVLKDKLPGMITRFNKLLGIYVVDEI